MLKALLAIFRPLYTIARELTAIRKLYELELANRMINPNAVERPLIMITDKPKKGDVQVTYQGEGTSRWQQLEDEWADGPDEEAKEDVL